VPHEWYEVWWKAKPKRSAAAEDAQLQLLAYQTAGFGDPRDPSKGTVWFRTNLRRAEVASAASLVGYASNLDPFRGAVIHFSQLNLAHAALRSHLTPGQTVKQAVDVVAFGFTMGYRAQMDPGPPEALYLALRSTRQASHDSPDDPIAYLLRGQVYNALYHQTRESRYATSELREIRTAQICVSLQTALRLDPDLLEAHHLLFELYANLNIADLKAEHFSQWLRLDRERGRLPGETTENFDKRIKQMEDALKRMEDLVESLKTTYTTQTPDKEPWEKAAIAFRKFGLAQTAVDELTRMSKEDYQRLVEKSQLEARGTAAMQIDLWFLLGRTDDIAKTLAPAPEQSLDKLLDRHPQYRTPVYDWLRLKLAASVGNYEEADGYFEPMIKSVQDLSRGEIARLFVETFAHQAPRATGFASPLADLIDFRLYWRAGYDQMLLSHLGTRQREAELRSLRGWLALEAGNIPTAKRELQRAFLIWWPPEHYTPVLLTLGAPGQPQAFMTLFAGGSQVILPQFLHGGFALVDMGLRWIATNEK
jgi:hypothetical protein